VTEFTTQPFRLHAILVEEEGFLVSDSRFESGGSRLVEKAVVSPGKSALDDEGARAYEVEIEWRRPAWLRWWPWDEGAAMIQSC
jgi:hypothetical protein